MDITTLNLKDIELFALAYTVAEQAFGVEPINATPKKQKKIRKWVNKTYLDMSELSGDILAFIDKSRSDIEYIEFLSECNNYINEQDELKKQLINKATADFSEEVKDSIDFLINTQGYCYNAEISEDKIIIPLDYSNYHTRKLILYTNEKNDLSSFTYFNFERSEIKKEKDNYKLTFKAGNDEWDTETPVSISFYSVDAEINIYRADRTDFGITPWDTLISISNDILSKKELGNKYFNQKEQELMPLIKELSGLSAFSRLLDDEYKPSFEILKGYIIKHKLNRIIPFLDKAVEEYKNTFSKQMHLIRLNNKLNEKGCEALWRELFEIIASTQEGYPEKALCYNKERLNEIRENIEKKFHSLGYEGKYPTFRKKGDIKGIKLEESYNQTYFIGLEKNVEYLIQCSESLYENNLQIEFLCGTALLKKGENVTDIYSCCFNAHGRRLFKYIYLFEGDDPDNDIFEQIDHYTKIAAKKAECKRLDKSDRKLLGENYFAWGNFFTILFFAGGLFAALMTLAMVLFVCILTAIETGFSAVPKTVGMMPWKLCFWLCFFGFGGAMAVIETLAKRK